MKGGGGQGIGADLQSKRREGGKASKKKKGPIKVGVGKRDKYKVTGNRKTDTLR